MELYTMGFTQKSAERFFGLISENRIELLVDVRLNNRSQLAGFTKGEDLAFFLHKLCGCGYCHREDMAPTKDILDAYKKGTIGWEEYEELFIPLMKSRGSVERFLEELGKYDRVLLLCSEPTPEKCHRRLLAELIAEAGENIEIKHI